MLRSIIYKLNKDMCCRMFTSRAYNMAGAFDRARDDDGNMVAGSIPTYAGAYTVS